MGKREIDEVIQEAAKRNIELGVISLRPPAYDELLVELTLSQKYVSEKPEGCLMYKNVRVVKLACEGCCSHG